MEKATLMTPNQATNSQDYFKTNPDQELPTSVRVVQLSKMKSTNQLQTNICQRSPETKRIETNPHPIQTNL